MSIYGPCYQRIPPSHFLAIFLTLQHIFFRSILRLVKLMSRRSWKLLEFLVFQVRTIILSAV